MKKRDPLLSKLRTPVHIDFIATYILKEDKVKTREILQEYINAGIIEESKLAKNYFGLTKQDSKK